MSTVIKGGRRPVLKGYRYTNIGGVGNNSIAHRVFGTIDEAKRAVRRLEGSSVQFREDSKGIAVWDSGLFHGRIKETDEKDPGDMTAEKAREIGARRGKLQAGRDLKEHQQRPGDRYLPKMDEAYARGEASSDVAFDPKLRPVKPFKQDYIDAYSQAYMQRVGRKSMRKVKALQKGYGSDVLNELQKLGIDVDSTSLTTQGALFLRDCEKEGKAPGDCAQALKGRESEYLRPMSKSSDGDREELEGKSFDYSDQEKEWAKAFGEHFKGVEKLGAPDASKLAGKFASAVGDMLKRGATNIGSAMVDQLWQMHIAPEWMTSGRIHSAEQERRKPMRETKLMLGRVLDGIIGMGTGAAAGSIGGPGGAAVGAAVGLLGGMGANSLIHRLRDKITPIFARAAAANKSFQKAGDTTSQPISEEDMLEVIEAFNEATADPEQTMEDLEQIEEVADKVEDIVPESDGQGGQKSPIFQAPIRIIGGRRPKSADSGEALRLTADCNAGKKGLHKSVKPAEVPYTNHPVLYYRVGKKLVNAVVLKFVTFKIDPRNAETLKREAEQNANGYKVVGEEDDKLLIELNPPGNSMHDEAIGQMVERWKEYEVQSKSFLTKDGAKLAAELYKTELEKAVGLDGDLLNKVHHVSVRPVNKGYTVEWTTEEKETEKRLQDAVTKRFKNECTFEPELTKGWALFTYYE